MVNIKIVEYDMDITVKPGKDTEIHFRGSDHWRDIRQGLKFWPVCFHGRNVVYGIKQGHESAYNRILSEIPHDVESITLKGHSIGGAYAQMFAYDFVHGYDRVDRDWETSCGISLRIRL